MRYKIYYNKGLRMSEGKVAAQVAHVTLNIGFDVGQDCLDFSEYLNVNSLNPTDQTIIVLGLSNKKFQEQLAFIEEYEYSHIQKDLGFTEVEEGTITAFGFIEEF